MAFSFISPFSCFFPVELAVSTGFSFVISCWNEGFTSENVANFDDKYVCVTAMMGSLADACLQHRGVKIIKKK
jgi:hypothetical protein